MKKSVGMLSVVLGAGLLLGACSDGEKSVSEAPKAPKQEETKAAPKEEKKEQAPEVGTRTNPVKPGQVLSVKDVTVYDLDDSEKVTTGSFELTLTKVTRGAEAFTKIKTYNQFNEPAPEGFEYALMEFKMTGEIEDPNIAEYVSPSMNVIASDGSEIEQGSVVLENEFGSKDLFDGGTVAGQLAIIVPVGDEDVVVEYSDDFSAFFSLK